MGVALSAPTHIFVPNRSAWATLRATMNPTRVIVASSLVCLSLAACQSGEAPKEQQVNVVVPKPSATATSTVAANAPSQPAKPNDIPAPADVASPPADAVKEKSGLSTKVITEGKGKDRPRTFDSVKVHYTGWTKDGKMFDSSVARGAPAEFGVEEVIKGWTEGLQLMVEGEKRRFWIPAALAYG